MVRSPMLLFKYSSTEVLIPLLVQAVAVKLQSVPGLAPSARAPMHSRDLQV
jgi:hypothetical protein